MFRELSPSLRGSAGGSSSASRAATRRPLGARLFDDLVDRVGEVLMQFLCCPGDRRGRDSEVAGQITGALLEFCAPFAVGGAGNGESQLESLGLLAGLLLGRGFPRLLLGRRVGGASAPDAGYSQARGSRRQEPRRRVCRSRRVALLLSSVYRHRCGFLLLNIARSGAGWQRDRLEHMFDLRDKRSEGSTRTVCGVVSITKRSSLCRRSSHR